MARVTRYGNVENRSLLYQTSWGYWYPVPSNLALKILSVPPYVNYAIQELGDIRNKMVLDCGTGSGMTAALLSRRAAAHSFDIEDSASIAKRIVAEYGNISNVHFKVMNMCSLEYADNSFDAALGIQMLHHVGNIREAAKELNRVLKPGGKAVFAETWRSSPVRRFRSLASKLFDFVDVKERALDRTDIIAFSMEFGSSETTVPEDIFCLWKPLAAIGSLPVLRKMAFAFEPMSLWLEMMDRLTYRALPMVRNSSYFIMLTVTK